MGLSPTKRGCYTVKTYDSSPYTWCPDTTVKKGKAGANIKKEYCTAIPYSQGEDWICTYVYQLDVVNGVQKRLAYVECDYVQ